MSSTNTVPLYEPSVRAFYYTIKTNNKIRQVDQVVTVSMSTRGPPWTVAMITEYDKEIVHEVDMKFMIGIGMYISYLHQAFELLTWSMTFVLDRMEIVPELGLGYQDSRFEWLAIIWLKAHT